VDFVLRVTGEEEGFVQTAFEVGKWIDRARYLHHVLMAHPLPSFGEDALFTSLVPGGVFVKGAGKSGCMLDSGIDIELGHGHILTERIGFHRLSVT
jgi:hypothetical protein